MKFVVAGKLIPGMILSRNVLDEKKKNELQKGAVLDDALIDHLVTSGYEGVYVETDQVKDMINDDLYSACLSAVRKNDISSIIKHAEEITGIMQSQMNLCLDFKVIRSTGDYLAHHSVCVAIYATAIAIQLGLKNSEVVEVCTAGLLHDLGKTKISASILNKPDRLTDEEYETIKKHPEFSLEMIQSNREISPAIKDAVLLHHEHENGTGYPMGKSEDDIPLFAKILHVADVFDALTSKRPSKIVYSHADAMEYLEGGKDILFSSRCVSALRSCTALYPNNIEVKLSNGEQAIVKHQTEDMKRPVIIISDKEKIVNLMSDMAYENVYIVELVDKTEKVPPVRGDGERPEEPSGKRKVVIVDDVYVSLIQTKLALEPKYEVTICNNPRDAISAVKTLKPDLILMDYAMPALDGASLTKKIRKLGFTDIPVIFLTGKSDKDTVIDCKKAGAADYIIKPANPVYLRARVALALGDPQDEFQI